MKPETVKLFGKLAHNLRRLVGGRDINGFEFAPASIIHCAVLIPELRFLLDEYDNAIMSEIDDVLEDVNEKEEIASDAGKCQGDRGKLPRKSRVRRAVQR